ncbi:AidA/PixA family protein [Streptomyces sp. VNUA116]|uniref:AidA/PixA family protein n=1 Tax=Streptomyces sp. VNUA116 TaxID=3062449 RepID=UPI0026745254|nr:AidA/PixA family protein [Streptomyces sp. VNUA116]WKU48464.1 AidA/PixA family protein [Streptomyces sp. VNUA116]
MATEADLEDTPALRDKHVIDALVMFDIHTIVKNYPVSGNPDEPTPVSGSLISILTRQNGFTGSPGADLTIKAGLLDVIKWREAALSFNDEHSALLYRFVPRKGEELISPPRSLVSDAVVPHPAPKDGEDSYTVSTVKSHFWYSVIEAYGQSGYEFRFQVISGKDRVGFYRWDPDITIVKRGI